MAKISETYIRQAFLARFARMGRESQNAVIEAMETIRDGTNLGEEIPDQPAVAGTRTFDTPSLLEGQTMAFPERTPGAATILGEQE